MNHEKAIEEAAHSAANEIIIHPGLRMSPIIARHMRSLAESIQRAESQRVDTSPDGFPLDLVARCSICGHQRSIHSAVNDACPVSETSLGWRGTKFTPIAGVPSEGVPPAARQERCVWCGCLTTDWLDTDWSRGRICRACEGKHDPAKAQLVEPAASETPETDAATEPARYFKEESNGELSELCMVVSRDFARDLERRLRASEAERKRLIPLAYETRPGMAIGPVTWQECYKHALKSYYDTQGERDAALARVAKLEDLLREWLKPCFCDERGTCLMCLTRKALQP